MNIFINFHNSSIFDFFGIPLLIFLAKIIDVSLSTLGLIFISKGYKKLSSLLSFIEICIYLFAISKILENLTNIYYYLSYAGGYALGTYIGIWIEEKLSIGFVHIRMITKKNANKLISTFKEYGYDITKYQAKSLTDRVDVIYTVVKRNELNNILDIIKSFDKKAFYSVEDIRTVSDYSFRKAG